MPIQHVPCGKDVMNVCGDALHEMFGCQGLHGEFSVPAFVISLQQCSKSGCKEALIQNAGYKFMALDSNGATTLCDVDQNGETLETGCVAMGTHADLWMEMVTNLDGYSESEDIDYEVRMLSVPGLLIDAVWLHSEPDEETDLVIPVAPLDEQLQAQPVFEMDTFLDIIEGLATERMRHSDI